jgi:hypothetical protein
MDAVMRDADVRVALRHRLVADHGGDPNTRIIEEMGIWAASVRIDIAVINGQMHGYELKSASDTLQRLPDQAALYNQVFDLVTLVTAENHYSKAVKEIPDWWGICIAVSERDGTVTLHKERGEITNIRYVPLQLARLLWRSELLDVLESYGVSRGIRSKSVEAMAERAAQLPSDILRHEVRQALKRRPRAMAVAARQVTNAG